MARRGPKIGKKYCDFLGLLSFLAFIKKNQPVNVYKIYNGPLRWDSKKIYRYLRYAMKINLVKLAYTKTEGFLPAKFYQLTPTGTALIELGIHKQTNPLITRAQ